jgi:hypothetical protein
MNEINLFGIDAAFAAPYCHIVVKIVQMIKKHEMKHIKTSIAAGFIIGSGAQLIWLANGHVIVVPHFVAMVKIVEHFERDVRDWIVFVNNSILIEKLKLNLIS